MNRPWLLGCIGLALAASGCASHSNPARPAQARGPGKFSPTALSAVDARELWLLGTAPCPSGRCSLIFRSRNGGQTFARAAAPPLPVEGYTPTIAFADARNGFVFVPDGRSPLYATHNAGATWHRQAIGDVLALATARATAYAVTARCSTDGCTHLRFVTASPNSTVWTATQLPFTPDSSLIGLAARGPEVWLYGTRRGDERRLHHRLARSLDAGRTWSSGPGPCYPDLGGELIPASARILWAVCPTGMLGGALRSTNGGASFRQLRTRPLANSAQLAAASANTAVLFGNGAGSRLIRTTDGGRSWTPGTTPRMPIDVWSVHFVDAHIGFALVQTRANAAALWRTTDGGARWSELRIWD